MKSQQSKTDTPKNQREATQLMPDTGAPSAQPDRVLIGGSMHDTRHGGVSHSEFARSRTSRSTATTSPRSEREPSLGVADDHEDRRSAPSRH